MTAQEPANNETPPKSTNQLLLSLLLASGIPVFSGAAYITGISYHYAYLASFGIPEKLISKTTSDIFIYAYTAISEIGISLISLTGLLVVGWIVAAVYFWQIINSAEKKIQNSQGWFRLRQRFKEKPGVKFLGRVMFVPVIVTALSYVVFTFFIVFLLPTLIGHQAGIQRARDDAASFKMGCANPDKKEYSCISVFEDKLLIASGFVIDSSENFIAIYEGDAVRTLPVENKHFVVYHSTVNR